MDTTSKPTAVAESSFDSSGTVASTVAGTAENSRCFSDGESGTQAKSGGCADAGNVL
jgi:hypothetical protein